MLSRKEIETGCHWSKEGQTMHPINAELYRETVEQLIEWLEEWVAAECDPEFHPPIIETVSWLREAHDE